MHDQPHLHRQRTVGRLLLPILLVAAPLAHAQLGLGLSPMREEIHLEPGMQQSGTLMVSNDSAANLRIRAGLVDFFLDAEATPQFVPNAPKEAPFSCRQWLSVNPMEWEQGPGTGHPVRFTVRAPAGAGVQSYHCGIAFTALAQGSEGRGIGLRMAVRAVTVLYVFVGNPQIQGALKAVSLENAAGSAGTAFQGVVVVENSGSSVFRPAGEFAVLDEQGKVLETHELAALPVLPKREQRLIVPLEHVNSQGRYTLRARVDIGTGEIQEGTAVVIARPPGS